MNLLMFWRYKINSAVDIKYIQNSFGSSISQRCFTEIMHLQHVREVSLNFKNTNLLHFALNLFAIFITFMVFWERVWIFKKQNTVQKYFSLKIISIFRPALEITTKSFTEQTLFCFLCFGNCDARGKIRVVKNNFI